MITAIVIIAIMVGAFCITFLTTFDILLSIIVLVLATGIAALYEVRIYQLQKSVRLLQKRVRELKNNQRSQDYE